MRTTIRGYGRRRPGHVMIFITYSSLAANGYELIEPHTRDEQSIRSRGAQPKRHFPTVADTSALLPGTPPRSAPDE